jgi:hypothetical protein
VNLLEMNAFNALFIETLGDITAALTITSALE